MGEQTVVSLFAKGCGNRNNSPTVTLTLHEVRTEMTHNCTSEQAIDRTRERAEEALARADEWLKPTGLSIKQQPMTVLAAVGGLAFAAGAIWMLRNSRQQSRYDALLATLSDLPRRAGLR
jgi:hypothetical protein